MSPEIKTPEEFAENLELLLNALVENTQSTDINLERLKNESMNHKDIDKYSTRMWQLFMATVPGILASIGLVM